MDRDASSTEGGISFDMPDTNPPKDSGLPSEDSLPDNSNNEESCDLEDDTQQKPSSTTTALDKPNQPVDTQIQPVASAPATATRSFGVPSVSFITSTRTPTPSVTEVPSNRGEPDYMAIINKWLRYLDIRTLKYDPMLAQNAFQCSNISGGIINHTRYPGSKGQVMAGGGKEDFENVYVYGWLAEKKALFPLDMDWDENQTPKWDHGNQTLHAELLADQATNPDGTTIEFTKTGCGWAWNVWTCHLA